MSHGQRINHVAIIGGGLVGWLAAAILARGLKGQGIRFTLVDIPTLSHDDRAESSLPSVRPLHEMLGFNEQQFMSQTQASFKLATGYKLSHQTSFTHSFGRHGITLPGVPFEQSAIKLKHACDDTAYEEYFLAAVAARQGKFALPMKDDKSILSTLSYGLHVDSKAYARYLEGYARDLQVTSVNADIQGLAVQANNGFIEAVVLDDGSSLNADLFIDCSGAQARLIGDTALAVPYDSWTQYLPVDRIVNFSSRPTPEMLPLSHINVMPWGWHKTIPLQTELIHQFIFNRDLLNDADLLPAMAQFNKKKDLAIISRTIKPGCRQQWWIRNCIAVGAAAGDISSLAISELQWAQSGLVRLLDYFPDKSCKPGNTAEYNRLSLTEFERIRDFHIAHHTLMQRMDSSFGKLCQNIQSPDTLQHRLDLFCHRGRVAAYEYDVVSDQLWIAFLLGLNLWPERVDPLADNLRIEDAVAFHQRIKTAVKNTANKMPRHNEFLARYCPARQ